jgi:hypothetical protein
MQSMNIDALQSLMRYEPETGHIYWLALGKGRIKKKPAGTLLRSGYVGICVGVKRWQAHRLAWALHYGAWPSDQIDHINGVKTDNRICNLRQATNSQNGKNLGLSKANTSGVKGVSFEKYTARWKASIRVDGKNISLGRFDSIAAAAEARKEAEKIYFKEWNRT